MSHEIAFENGKAMAFYADSPAWHKLGQLVAGARSWDDARELAGLNWTVGKEPLYDSFGVELPQFGIFRQDNRQFLGAVGDVYEPCQNEQAFSFVDALLEANGGTHYDSAGALRNGKIIWVSARVPSADIEPIKGDVHQSYLLFTTSHDGSGKIKALITRTRVVCMNTLSSALSSAEGVLAIKHTKTSMDRLEHAKKLVRNVQMDSELLKEKLAALAARKLTREAAESIFTRLFPIAKEQAAQTRRNNVLADILSLYERNDGGSFPQVAGTAYGLLNAVTNYTDHSRTIRLTDSRGDMSAEQARAESSIFGSGSQLKSQALEVILEETNGAPVHHVAETIYPTAPSFGGILDDVISVTPTTR